MPDPFASAKLTLRRAHHHINDLETQISKFRCSSPWTHVVENEYDSARNIHKLRFAAQIPEIWPCILFDIANNLRAVLDQVGYASALARGSIDPNQTRFPFGDDPVGLENVIKRKGSNDLPIQILSLFRGFKPYKGGNDTLWALNKLCNTKKHCSLVLLVVENASVTFNAIGSNGSTIVSPATTVGWDPEKYEITLLSAGGVAKDEIFQIDANVAFDMAIEGIETLSGKSAITALKGMASEVEGVLKGTETECRKLGFVR